MNTSTTVNASIRWAKIPVLLQAALVGFLSWYFFKPVALTDEAWRLFVIFVSTVVAIILKPLPRGRFGAYKRWASLCYENAYS